MQGCKGEQVKENQIGQTEPTLVLGHTLAMSATGRVSRGRKELRKGSRMQDSAVVNALLVHRTHAVMLWIPEVCSFVILK